MRVAVLAALALAAGCGDRRLNKAQAVKDRACACQSVECLEEAIASFAEIDSRSIEARYRGRLEGIAREIVGCMDRIRAAENPNVPEPELPNPPASP